MRYNWIRRIAYGRDNDAKKVRARALLRAQGRHPTPADVRTIIDEDKTFAIMQKRWGITNIEKAVRASVDNGSEVGGSLRER
jgi:hypothetical protein